MRRLALLFLTLAAACNDRQLGSYGTNEIVFGIEQSSAGITADYEVLGLSNLGGSVAVAFRADQNAQNEGTGDCFFERLDERLGHARTETGVASWTGGAIPAAGVVTLANQNGPTKATGPGWATGDTLSFYAEGFAMPPLQRVELRAPLVELAVGAITPAPDPTTNVLAAEQTADITVQWTPPAERSRVMVAFTTERAQVRCFVDADTGNVRLPKDSIAAVFAASNSDAGLVRGNLLVASHRQATLAAQGGWIVYVVATHVHKDIPVTLR